eukprot:CAMPEP_0116124144 /NCGR_PEP_ID=MMETSP0329-20121206/5128_1 /TAXON_ID=697910 /ORGANISM="Pseudo-nitzschia arenysensis, Strain B593" /LENGTH=451 /DNA_ID=CAMNT_0003618113 /DNA_START=202 /DNA_END=1557 /DNA_ORIENTATION=+
MEDSNKTNESRSVKRRAEESFSSAALKLDAGKTFPTVKGVSSRDFGIEGLEVSDFEQTERTTQTATTLNSTNNNSYFCIGSGSGCVDRSVSQTCLTRELDQLPLNRREHVGQDLYGLAEECIPKVDELMLEELEKAIQALLGKAESKQQLQQQNQKHQTLKRSSSLPISNSAPELQALVPYHAYKLALSRNPSYVRNPEFRLMFLRATEGDTKKAAKRLTRHFKTKLRLFGEDKLGRDIVLDDLGEDDMEALKSGGFQVLKKRDAAGRSVLFGRYTSMKYKTIDNMLRALWYIWMSILEDPVNQMKGVVAVGYEVGRVPLDRFNETTELDDAVGFEMDNMNGGFDRTLAREIVSVPLSVPARPVGYHLCTDSHQWVGILNMVMVTLCKFIRLRMRIHHGTDQECKYALMTHGMPTDCVPVDDSGYVSLTNHLEWIDHRRILDAQKLTSVFR